MTKCLCCGRTNNEEFYPFCSKECIVEYESEMTVAEEATWFAVQDLMQ